MNTSAPHTRTPPPSSPLGGFFESVRRLGIWRSPDRWGGGVAAGIGHRYGIDPLVVRGLFVVVTMFGGIGLVLYGLAWALLPEASDGRIHLEQAVRGHFDIALAGAAAVLVVGISRPVFWWSASWWTVPWLVALGALIAVVLIGRDRGTTRPTYPADGRPPAPGHPGRPGYEPGTAGRPDDGPATSASAPPPPRPAYDVPEDTMAHPPTTDGPDGPGTEVITRPTVAGPVTSTSTDDAGSGRPWDTTDQQEPGQTGPSHADADPWDTRAGWSGAGWGDGNATPPHPGPPAPPPPPPVPGPGSRTTSLVLAVSLLVAAGVALAHQQGALDANPWLIGGGAVLVVLGLGVIVSGMRGRTQGGIGALALVVAIVVAPLAGAAATLPGFARIGSGATTWAGDPSWAPRTAADAEQGYSLVAGQLLVDLSGLDADEEVTIPVSVTFGNLDILVPDDADVTINADVGAGEVLGRLDGDWTGANLPWGTPRSSDSLINGVGISTTLSQDGSGPQIIVDAEVSFGQITIEETS